MKTTEVELIGVETVKENVQRPSVVYSHKQRPNVETGSELEHRLRGKDSLTSSCLCWLLTVSNKKSFERFVDGKKKMKRKETKLSSRFRGSDKATL